ncbi:MAG: hypothetical protein LBL65_07950 [Campylobacteraceae bacterium]|jgi:hypothetical protein|nr:hypothetical protein [Campylobacteraceae bacterium]
MTGLGVELSIAIATIILLVLSVKVKTADKGIRTMTFIYSVIFLIYALLQIAMKYDGSTFKAASNTSLEGFVCEDKNEILNTEQKQERIKEIEKAIDSSVGLTFGGHDIPWFSIQPRWKNLYRLQKKFSLEDWGLLADMYNSGERYSHKKSAIYALFVIGGDRAIAIFECKANAKNLSSETKKHVQYMIDDLRGALNSYGIQQRIREIRAKEAKR